MKQQVKRAEMFVKEIIPIEEEPTENTEVLSFSFYMLLSFMHIHHQNITQIIRLISGTISCCCCGGIGRSRIKEKEKKQEASCQRDAIRL